MGGFGSGRWPRRARKTTAEETLAFGIGDLPHLLVRGLAGVFTWSAGDQEIFQIGYQMLGAEPWLVLDLHYQAGTCAVHLPLRIQATRPHFGGSRNWLTCPDCKRRVGKLYLPPNQNRFACRHCYKLSYRSCQDAHKRERLSKALAKMRERCAGLSCRAQKCKV